MSNKGLNIEDILARDEEILWRGNPKKSAYFTHAIFKHLGLTLVGLLAGFLPLLVFIRAPEQVETVKDGLVIAALGIVFGIFGLVQIIKMIKECIEHKNIEYALTNNRVILKSGIIGMDYKGLQYIDIGSVNLDVGVIDKIFKVGNIKVRYKGAYVTLHDLTECYKVYKIIQKIILDIQTDIEYPNALRPDENPGYNNKYKNGKGE